MSLPKRCALGVALTALLALASAATVSSASASAALATTYVKAVPLCHKPAAKHAQCFAMKRVRVSASTPGARPMNAHPAFATGPAGGYTPADLAAAYGVNADTATSQVVGIVDAFDDPNACRT